MKTGSFSLSSGIIQPADEVPCRCADGARSRQTVLCLQGGDGISRLGAEISCDGQGRDDTGVFGDAPKVSLQIPHIFILQSFRKDITGVWSGFVSFNAGRETLQDILISLFQPDPCSWW